MRPLVKWHGSERCGASLFCEEQAVVGVQIAPTEGRPMCGYHAWEHIYNQGFSDAREKAKEACANIGAGSDGDYLEACETCEKAVAEIKPEVKP